MLTAIVSLLLISAFTALTLAIIKFTPPLIAAFTEVSRSIRHLSDHVKLLAYAVFTVAAAIILSVVANHPFIIKALLAVIGALTAGCMIVAAGFGIKAAIEDISSIVRIGCGKTRNFVKSDIPKIAEKLTSSLHAMVRTVMKCLESIGRTLDPFNFYLSTLQRDVVALVAAVTFAASIVALMRYQAIAYVVEHHYAVRFIDYDPPKFEWGLIFFAGSVAMFLWARIFLRFAFTAYDWWQKQVTA